MRLRLTERQRRILEAMDRLGWGDVDSLAVLDGMAPGQRDYYLEEYLPRLVKAGKLYAKPWGRRLVYRLPKYGTARNPKVEHALLAGQVAVRLVSAAQQSLDSLLPRRRFVEAGVAQVPDAGVLVPTAKGTHLFLIEYQSAREAERTTADKIAGYQACHQRIREIFGVAGVWVVFVLDVLRPRAEEITRRHSNGWSAFYFCDRETFLACAWRDVLHAPLFFWSGAPGTYGLMAGREAREG